VVMEYPEREEGRKRVLRVSNRSPFRDTEINLDGYSYQSRVAPEASNRSTRTGHPARPFGEEVRSESPLAKLGSVGGEERGMSQLCRRANSPWS